MEILDSIAESERLRNELLNDELKSNRSNSNSKSKR